MRIVHVAPFAPGRCGLYESVRDLMTGERRLGHEVVLVDSGVPGEGHHYGEADGEVCAGRPDQAAGADVLVTHTAPSREVLRLAGDAPRVHVIHGRPESSFRLSQQPNSVSPVYDLYTQWARDGEVDQWVTLWPEHLAYWRAILPADRLASTSAPPCDLGRWSPEGPKHAWSPAGEHNVLIADPWRADSDPYHLVHGLLLLAERRTDWRVHLYAMETPLGPWEHLMRALRRAGVLGETCGMMRGMAERYRAADVVLTPQRIATRIVREASACGASVVTGEGTKGGRYGHFACDPQNPETVAHAVNNVLECGGGPAPIEPKVRPRTYDHVAIAAELVALFPLKVAA